MKFNSVTVTPVRSLEVGDLIAHQLFGRIVSGKITGIAEFGFQLTEAERIYMVKNNLNIPTHDSLAGNGYCIVFGDFGSIKTSSGYEFGTGGHMCLDYNTNVAVFPTKD